MQIITSKDNESIKHIRKLKDKKYREESQQYVIEGVKLLQEAIEEKAQIDTIVVCEDCIDDPNIGTKMVYEVAKYPCLYVSQKVFSAITEVSNPQGILAVVKKRHTEQEIDYEQDIIVVLDGIQDPGNLGTILRTVDSVGLNQIIVSKQTADAFNPKVVRSTMGAIFRVKIIESEDLTKTLQEMKKHKFKVAVTSLQTEQTIYQMDYHKRVFVIGNEANGVTKELLKIADETVKIPMLGKTESLNAAVATGVVLYEYVRRQVQTEK